MSIRSDNLISGEYYHVYNRGNGKQEIFLDNEDYQRFIKLLYVCNSEKNFKFRDVITNRSIDIYAFERGTPLVSILSWVVMPNHFHIFLNSHRSDLWEKNYNPITEFMRKVATAYAMYFNKKYSRSGSLFEGKFKSKLLKDENQFLYLFSYIHLNPIKLIQHDWKKNGIKNKDVALKYLKEYSYSSFIDYMFNENRNTSKIIDKNVLPESIKNSHVDDLFNWIKL
jgi:putative transposase